MILAVAIVVESKPKTKIRLSIALVCLSQTWACGATLTLPDGTKIRELGAYPSLADLWRSAPGCQRVALYRDRLEDAPEFETRLHDHGFETAGVFNWGMSRSVVVFRPAAPERTVQGGHSGG
jgi:hypothetical protein